MEELMQRIDKTSTLLERVDNLSRFNGFSRLRRKFVAELRFLDDLKTKDEEKIEGHLHSSNLPFLEAVLKIAENMDVDTVFANYIFYDENDREKQITVDVVTTDEKQWIKVIARNPHSLYRTWLGQGQYGSKDICEIGKEFINAKQHICMDANLTSVIFHFENGILERMVDDLRGMGIIVTGEIIREGDKASTVVPLFSEIINNESLLGDNVDCDKVNLDITALVAMVSSITNGGCHMVYKDEVLNQQAKEERADPVLPKIESFLIGKDLYICKTAHKDFCSILSTVGGRAEKERADKLLAKVEIIDDAPSLKSQGLVESGRVRERSKIIFGTGDYMRAVTLTANSSFVRAAGNQGIKFKVFFHSPRALSEQKEPVLIPDK